MQFVFLALFLQHKFKPLPQGGKYFKNMKKMSLKIRKDAIGGAVKRVFILVIIAVFAVSNQVNAQSGKSNGTFEVVSVSKDSVVFKTVVATKLYNVSLVSGTQTVDASLISNIVGDMVFPNGATAIAGSTLRMPKLNGISALSLSKGAVINVSFKTDDRFQAAKVLFVTEEGKAAMSYDVSSKTWSK
jgi:hypothetical protein